MTQLLTTLRQPATLRKMLWLLIVTTLITVSIIIIPKVTTPSPAVESKMLALRMLLAATIVFSFVNRRTLAVPRWQFTDTIFAGLIGSFILSTLFSGRIGYCLVEGWHLGGFFAFGWIIFRFRPSPTECAGAVRIAGCLGFLAALYGFFSFVGIDLLQKLYPFSFEEMQAGGRNFVHSFYGNPEYFGGFAAPTAVILLGLGLRPQIGLFQRATWIVAAGFVLGVLALSGSRGAFLGFIGGAVIVFIAQIGFLSKKIQRVCWATTGLAVIALAAGLIILSTPNPLNSRDMRLAQRFTDIINTKSASVRERLLFYTSTAIAIPVNPIFGYGPFTYRLEFFNNVKLLVEEDKRGSTAVLLKELQRRLAEHTHNDYLEIWFEQGTMGFALLLLLIVHGGVRFVKTRWRVHRSKPGIHVLGSTALYVTIFGAIITIYINALTSFPLHMPARGILSWTLVGVFFVMDRHLDEARRIDSGIEEDSQTSEKDESI